MPGDRPFARAGRLLAGLALLVAFQFAGTLVVRVTRVPMPGSVMGMLLLAGALRASEPLRALVRPAAALLLRHMMLFYIPAGVGLMLYGDVLRREWLPIAAGSLASLLLVLVVVGALHQRLERDA